MVPVSHFVGDKLLVGAFAVAFASGLSQAEAFSGQCGLDPHFMHIPSVILQALAFVLCLMQLVGARKQSTSSTLYIQFAIVAIFGMVTIMTQGWNIPVCDILLIEAGILSLVGWNDTVGKLLITNVLFSTALSKYMNMDCDGSWMSFSSLKSDALNQPFPFTPVWHIAQLPSVIVEGLSVLIVLSEVILPFVLLFAKKSSGMESASSMGIIGLGLFYALIGNFNWAILILLSWVIRYVPDDICILILGKNTFARWGLESVKLHEDTAEAKLVQSLLASAKLSVVFLVLTIAVKYVARNDISNWVEVATPYKSVISACLWAVVVYVIRNIGKSKFKHGILVAALLVLSRTEFVSLLSFSQIGPLVDYSSLPTCYTFHANSEGFPVHSKRGRAGFLFQTKYTQLGTNTIGSDLGGTKYAELSVPGSVHADEQRPPFLLGHLPRLALTIWKMGTSNEKNIQEGLILMDRLANIVREGGDGMKVFFANTPDFIIAAHIGKTNQIQGFYQDFTVTSRAADHQWWKRSYDNVSALPSSHMSLPAVRTRCSIVVPPKVFDVPLELILIMIVLGVVCAKLLFSSNKTSRDIKKKQK